MPVAQVACTLAPQPSPQALNLLGALPSNLWLDIDIYCCLHICWHIMCVTFFCDILGPSHIFILIYQILLQTSKYIYLCDRLNEAHLLCH